MNSKQPLQTITCSYLTIKTPERCYWCSCSVIIVKNFEQILHRDIVFLLLTLNKFQYNEYLKMPVLSRSCNVSTKNTRLTIVNYKSWKFHKSSHKEGKPRLFIQSLHSIFISIFPLDIQGLIFSEKLC